ncbi:MAG: 5-oxoprolinase subunit PxpA [Rhodospirillum sp.]|nr:5-oxoprolinase subunit PxpA [Rhodospirillum sp.]MCF8488959.1 5-oxoprolinase subunit PxpA [Rhodospirillum sp.]
MRVNLNADMGESFGMYRMGDDDGLLSIVGSANVACGFHGGDPMVMRRTIALARENGVSIGAHPSFPDLVGFGRRFMAMAPKDLEATLLYQLAALEGMARVEEHAMTHVKPHGALNNAACEDADLAGVIARSVALFDKELILLAPALSELEKAGRAAGLKVGIEVFADRAYTESGSLVPRSQPDAMVEGGEASLAHVTAMLDAGGLVTRAGKVLPTEIHSICVHGDGVHAVAAARALRNGLKARGATLAPLDRILA